MSAFFLLKINALQAGGSRTPVINESTNLQASWKQSYKWVHSCGKVKVERILQIFSNHLAKFN